jgi:hypothetical protein
MSIRRFTALLRGLSPESNFHLINNTKETIIDDPVVAERAVNRFWK